MRRATTMALLMATWLGGCGGGGGGAPAVTPPDPVEHLGTLLVDLAASFSAAAFDMRPFLAQGSSTTPGVALFETLVLTEADVGRTFVASPADDPDFGALVATLTNGVDDVLIVVVRMGTSSSRLNREESLLLQGASGPLAPDFAGSTITRIELRVEALSLDSPGRDLLGDGDWTDMAVILRIEFFGVRR